MNSSIFVTQTHLGWYWLGTLNWSGLLLNVLGSIHLNANWSVLLLKVSVRFTSMPI